MKKLNITVIVLAAFAAAFNSCKVDERYSIDNIKDVDTDVTLFENGLEIPIVKNSVELRADSLLEKAELSDSIMRFLVVGDDGKYHIIYDGVSDLDSLIDSFGIDTLLKIDGISFKNNFDFSLGGLDVNDIQSPAQEFGQEIVLPDFTDILDLNIDPVLSTTKTGTGFGDKDFDIEVDVESVYRSTVICSKTALTQAATVAEGLSMTEVQIPGSGLNLSMDPFVISSFSKPSNVKSVTGVTLASGAKLSITLSISPANLISSGTVTTSVSIDMSDLLVFEGGSGVLDLDSLSLAASNGYSVSKNYNITGLNVAKLFSEKSISLTGHVDYNCKATTAAAKAATEDFKVNVAISFDNLSITSVQCELEEMKASVSENIDISLPEITLPSEVSSIDWVSFTDSSKISIDICAENLSKITGLSMKADTLKISFPSELQISGAGVSGNVLTVTNADIAGGISKVVKIEKLNLTAPVGGKVNYNGKAAIEAKCSAYGLVDTKDINALGTSDVNIVAQIVSSIAVKDFSVKTNTISKSIPSKSGEISFTIPDEAGSYGTFAITPEGSPKISIKAEIPDLGDLSINAGNGVKVTLPGFIKFGSVASSSDYSFDAASNILTLNKIVSETIDLPIESLILTPVKEGGIYKVKGDYSIDGEVSIASGTIGKSTLDKLSGAKVKFNAGIPQVKAATFAVDSISFEVNENVKFNVTGFESIPDMLVEIGEILLDDVNATLSLDLQGLPSIGTGKFIVDVNAFLPDFVTPNVIPVKGEIKNGKFTATPTKISGFDFSGRDIQKMKADNETLSDSISICGKIYAQNPSVDVKSLSSTINGKFEASICDENDKIGLKSMSARLDYHLDTLISAAFPEIPDVLSDLNLDLPTVTAVIGIGSNLGMPISGSASIIPVKDGAEDASKGVVLSDLKFPYSENPAVKDSVTNTLTLDLDPILNSKADSVHVRLQVQTDKSKKVTLHTDADYSLHIGYKLDAPVELGSEFNIEYADTVDISDAAQYFINFLPGTSLKIGGNVVNTMPLGVALELEFLAFDNAKGTYRYVDLGEIKSDIAAPGQESEFSIMIGPSGNVDLEGLSHVRFSVKVSSNGEALKPESSIAIKNVYVCLPKGLPVNSESYR